MHDNVVVIEAVINFSKLYEFASKTKVQALTSSLRRNQMHESHGIVNIEAVINFVN